MYNTCVYIYTYVYIYIHIIHIQFVEVNLLGKGWYASYSFYFWPMYIHGGPTGMVVANMAVDGPFFQPANVEDTGSHHSWL